MNHDGMSDLEVIAAQAIRIAQLEAPLPDAWRVTKKPNGGGASYHRARWVDGVLKCWECEAEYRPPTPNSGEGKHE
jgi:hypothetical protein